MPDFTMPRRAPFTFGDGRQVDIYPAVIEFIGDPNLAPWLVEDLDPVAEQAIDHLNRVIRNE